MAGTGRTTIKHVAEMAGVSIKTVSRVLNNERYVDDATRGRVDAAVAALAYRPSRAARSLAGGRAYQIALICDNPSPSYVYALQQGVRDRAIEDGVQMIAQPYDRGSSGLMAEIERMIATNPLDGLILTPPLCDHDGLLALVAAHHIPFVRISPGVRHGLAPAVFIDNAAAAEVVTAHLIARGHRRIAHIAGPVDFATSAQRLAGYRRARAAAGLADEPALIVPGAFDFKSGAVAAEQLLALPSPPDAIFAASDEMAAGALSVAHRRGIGVPRALAIAGFGDDTVSRYVWPPLTTIHQPVRDLAWYATDLLLTRAEPNATCELPFSLIERDST